MPQVGKNVKIKMEGKFAQRAQPNPLVFGARSPFLLDPPRYKITTERVNGQLNLKGKKLPPFFP